jgi:3-oxoadipate enol-lactonase
MADQQIRANGITLRCRVEGPMSGQVIVFSNSLCTDLSMWDDQVALFSNRYRVIRYDARGHGESGSTPPPYTLSMLTEDVRSLLDALGIEQVHFVGLSLGGMVGQLFAVRYPNRLLSLALCDTSARMKREIWEERLALARREGLEATVEASLQRWFTKPYRDRNPAIIDRIRQMIRRTSLDGYLGCSTAIMNMDNIEQLPRIVARTLVLVGRQDPATPVSDAEILHAQIGGSRLAIIDDAAHLPNIEQTQAFNAKLEEFLQHDGVRA